MPRKTTHCCENNYFFKIDGGRGTEDEEKMKVRLENAPAELEYGNTPGNFDATVVNNNLDEAYSEIINYLNKWYVDLALGVRPK